MTKKYICFIVILILFPNLNLFCSDIFVIKAPLLLNKTQVLNVYDINNKKLTVNSKFTDDAFAEVRGFFHETQILLPVRKSGIDGYNVIKPFSYVFETNKSSGWPSWYAFNAILINVGWIPKNTKNHNYLHLDYNDPLFKDPITISLKIHNLKTVPTSEFSIIHDLETENIDVQFLWEIIALQVRRDKIPPPGSVEIPLLFDLVELK